ncbi:unnamed protein product [Lasius platythorax]|uniref:Uncharacterized protein n=1 Tax=Lasius platythorax TaxID=488582 RepID=A0AAV2NQG1_9HYME
MMVATTEPSPMKIPSLKTMVQSRQSVPREARERQSKCRTGRCRGRGHTSTAQASSLLRRESRLPIKRKILQVKH